jgi:hypothetical protein
MRITIEIDSKTELEKLSALFVKFKINTVKVISSDDTISITKGDKTLDPKSLFGVWTKKPRDIESIRKAAWQRDQKI